MSTAKHPPHHHPSSSMLHGGNYTCGDLDSLDQRTDFHRSNVLCSCFLVQASLFFLLVSFSSGFCHEGLVHTVSYEQLMLRCVCYLNSVKHFFGLQFMRLVTLFNLSRGRGNPGSSFPVAVLMKASFIIVLDCVCDFT